MIYVVSAFTVVGMLGFMFYRAAYSLRQERVRNEREATRGKHAFTKVDRARFLLRRAFKPVEDPAFRIEAPPRLAASRDSDQPRA